MWWGDAASTSTGWAPPGTAPQAWCHRAALSLPEGTFSSDASITVSQLLGSTPGSPLAFSDASVL